ncbi:MAG: threonylcarbamoyl-AMP synthase [Candidatus Marinimicrobia bacterium]|nr:threonylcarbamoyl-AMP synthase [Candidatus Neomarinimicrobiota bacterium]
MKRLSVHDPLLIELACEILRNDGVIVYPTDTLYGFGVDATSAKAIEKINSIKRRSGPISVIAPDKKTAKSWIVCSAPEWNLIKEKLSGTTTVIAPVRESVVHTSIIGPDHTLGIRIPDQSVILDMAKQFEKPITTTSVNRSGHPAMIDPDKIISEFGNDIDLIIDAGPLSPSKGSSIFRLYRGELEVIR